MTEGDCRLVFISIAPSPSAEAGSLAQVPGQCVYYPEPYSGMSKAGLFQTDSDCLGGLGVVHVTPPQTPAARQLAVCGEELVVCTCAESTQQSPF